MCHTLRFCFTLLSLDFVFCPFRSVCAALEMLFSKTAVQVTKGHSQEAALLCACKHDFHLMFLCMNLILRTLVKLLI